MAEWKGGQLPAEDLPLLAGLRSVFCIGKARFVLFQKTVWVLCCQEEGEVPIACVVPVPATGILPAPHFKRLTKTPDLAENTCSPWYCPFAEVCHLVLLYMQTY